MTANLGGVWIAKSVGSGITIKDQGSYKGQFVIAISSAETAGIEPGMCRHEGDVTLGGKKSTVIYGNVAVEKSGV